jgi:hypothetical protein
MPGIALLRVVVVTTTLVGERFPTGLAVPGATD